MAVKKGVRLLISIVERGQGKNVRKFYTDYGLTCHFQTVGRGTASSDLLDILGVGSTERDIIFTFGEQNQMLRMLHQMQDDEESALRAKGIAFGMKLTALNTLAAAVLMGSGIQSGMEGAGAMQQNKEDAHTLVLIVVNQGHTDEVMNTAREAGARGGTIIRSHWAGSEESESFYGITLQAEKEIIAIVAGDQRRRLIMEAVNKKHGMNTEAGAMICSVALDQMQRLG